MWLDKTQFRNECGYSFEYKHTKERGIYIKDAVFWVLLQSDPSLDDRMYHNNETLRLSISALHAKNFSVSIDSEDMTQTESYNWRPVGAVENASYSRVECTISRKAAILEEEKIP